MIVRKWIGAAGMAALVLGTGMYFFFNEKEHLRLPEYPPIEEDIFIKARSEIGTKEDPQARKNYWYQLQQDPATGAISFDMRRKEIQYARTLPRKNTDPRFRNVAEDWESVGPYNIGGRTRSVKVHISDQNLLIAGGVSGGFAPVAG